LRNPPATKQVALMSAFAALIVLITRLPGIPIIGTPGAKLQLSVVLYPLVGVLLGGEIGAMSVLVGNFVSWLIPSSTLLGLLMIPPGALSALVAGSLGSTKRIFNWKLAFLVLLALDTLWYFTPVGLEAPFYPVLHWGSLLLVALFREKVHAFLGGPSKLRIMEGMAVCSFAGLMADSMAGNLTFIYAVGWVVPLNAVLEATTRLGMFWLRLGIPKFPFTGLAGLFMGALVITAIERTAMTIVSMLTGSAVLRLLGRDRPLTTT